MLGTPVQATLLQSLIILTQKGVYSNIFLTDHTQYCYNVSHVLIIFYWINSQILGDNLRNRGHSPVFSPYGKRPHEVVSLVWLARQRWPTEKVLGVRVIDV